MSLLVVMAAISVFVVLFALQNAQSVSLSFIFMEFESSLAFVTMMAFLCGLLVASCYVVILKTRQYMKDKKTKEEIDALLKEKAKLEELVAYLKEHQGEMPVHPKAVNNNPYAREIGSDKTINLIK